VIELLTTKFFIPLTRSELVPRPRLINELNDSLRKKLTLISAPAGFGKTTLVSDWVKDLRKAADLKKGACCKITWLSLDEGDNGLERFLAYFIAALYQAIGVDHSLSSGALEMLQSPRSPPTEVILTSLINEVATFPAEIAMVLDDYHTIESPSIDAALTFLLEHLPPRIHLIIITRVDPPFPMARLRARGQLAELRAADLRFTSTEAAEFLNHVMGLNLSDEDIRALEARTEGWIAGLHLAAISLQRNTDTSALIKSFTSSHRFVLDYLIEEVFEQQPENIQVFLLQTSILRRLTGSVCDALTGQDDSQAILEMLENANLFIVPLDEQRYWYRYHHLFAGLLRNRLNQLQPEKVPILHRKASEWYQNNGFTEQAIEHSLSAEDFDRAAVLVEQAWPEMHRSYQSVTWLRWAKEIPDELVRARPVLSTGYGWSLIDTGDMEGADLHLQDAERWFDTRAPMNEQSEVAPVRQVDLDQAALRSLSASIANARAYLAQAYGDVAATEKYAQQALDLLHENEYFERGLSAILAGFAYWASGDLEAAQRAITDAISMMQILGKIPFIISFTSYLADIMIAQGRLNGTKKLFLRLLDLAAERSESELPEMAVVHLGLSELYFEQDNLQSAKWHLQKSEELGELPAFPPWYRHWILMQVRIRENEGDLEKVTQILNEAESRYYRHPIPDVRPLPALFARALLVEGKLNEAMHWVRERGLSVDDDLSYLREFEHLTLVRVFIAQYKNKYDDGLINDAIGFLERLLKAAEEGGRVGSVIEILVLQALAHDAQGDIPSALVSIERALDLAEPEGYIRIFVDEGPSMAHVLYEALSRGIAPDYVRRLLAAFPDDKPDQAETSQTQTTQSGLIEPLSEREIEVLNLIASGLTNQAVAGRLYLSLNTVKVHTRNIYGKLGVNNRTGAVARAKALGILSPVQSPHS
jgi:LuxR family maltose regulon positive regulatory protein